MFCYALCWFPGFDVKKRFVTVKSDKIVGHFKKLNADELGQC